MSSPAPAGSRLVVCAWATPRSVSTAFEKTFTQRRRTSVVHEPFTNCYYFGPDRRSSRYGTISRPETADARSAIEWIRSTHGSQPEIFVKDLAFQAEPYLPDHFLSTVTNTFILRHPDLVHRSLRPLKPDFTEDEFGFTALHRLFQRVTDLAPDRRPVVVEGTWFRRSPERVLREYCARVGMAFEPGMTSWDDGRIRAWGPEEEKSQAVWHTTLEASSSVLPPSDDPVADGEAEAEWHRQPMYHRALEIYEEIISSGSVVAAAVVRR